MMPYSVLFVPHQVPAAREMKLVADQCVKGGLNTIFLSLREDLKECLLTEGVPSDNILSLKAAGNGAEVRKERSWLAELKSYLGNTTIGNYIHKRRLSDNGRVQTRIEQELASQQSLKAELEAVLDRCEPDVVGLVSDRTVVDALLVMLCEERGIPTVLIPFAVGADKMDLPRFRSQPEYDAKLFSSWAAKFPGQVQPDIRTGTPRFYYPPWVMGALDTMGCLPENPWVNGGGGVNFVLAESHNVRERYIDGGCPEEKIVVTGMCSHDNLYEVYTRRDEVRKELAAKYQFDSASPLVVFSVSAFYELGMKTWDEQYDFVTKQARVLERFDGPVLASLHPKMNPADYGFLEERFGIKLLSERLSNVLPVADVFIATIASTTAGWAELCRIPLILVDDLINECEYYTPTDTAVFFESLKDSTSFERNLGQALNVVNATDAAPSMFDGNSSVRICSALKTACGGNPN
ncbi:hypothetical protein [Pseudodesulfovibrio sp. zrk46]|uniref:hypothetical protein n=1 Tax=Pseudodesulfovibrio sp. zrk46 TaxID=2725288 RepID=UPI00144A17D2|nr:hypothetical protein [Pseudodesulfovibrio sp. zrk46]QJB56580.1 hypothetical protein HFN16_09230 [Pseudodesulfovibrio sp. zrk46]